MKVLSLTQPWATLVATGEKHVETRSWGCTFRGLIAIHASKGFPKWAKECAEDLEFEAALERHGYEVTTLPLGVIIAVCRVTACIRTETVPQGYEVLTGLPWTEQEKLFGDYSPGRFAWVLEGVWKLTEPIPAKGSLGLWESGPELELAIRHQVLAQRPGKPGA